LTSKSKPSKLEDLKPDERNANKGTERGRSMLEHSLRNLGAGRSILTDSNDNIIAGNKTHEVAIELGLPMRVIETDGNELIVVKRTDMQLYSDDDPRARELAWADNRVAEADFQVDPQRLIEDMEDPNLKLDWLFTKMEFEQVLKISKYGDGEATEPDEIPPGEGDIEMTPDAAERIRQRWGVEYGQLWQAGNHRLLVGDSRVKGSYTRLLGDRSAPITMMWTDPPYGVNYEGRTEDKLKIQNDTGFNLPELLAATFENVNEVLSDGAPIYIAHPDGILSLTFGNAFVTQGWHFHQRLIWVKDSMVLGHSDYHFQHEPIIYGWKGVNRQWFGERVQKTVFHVDRPKRSTEHPTMKPVDLIQQMLVNSARAGDSIIDTFVGSGSTIVAAETMHMEGYGMDNDPRFIAVTLERLQELGLECSLLENP
jgi:DNA modification methylase